MLRSYYVRHAHIMKSRSWPLIMVVSGRYYTRKYTSLVIRGIQSCIRLHGMGVLDGHHINTLPQFRMYSDPIWLVNICGDECLTDIVALRIAD